VTDREGKALARVEVRVLSETADVLQSGQTDNNGRYVIVVRSTRDQYVLSFRVPGYVAVSQTLNRTALSTVFEVSDVRLAKRLDILEPVVTRAVVLVPMKGVQPDIGTTRLNTTDAAQFLPDPSSVRDLLSTLPGVERVGDGLSILGADPSQNRTLVDGADFGGARIPRDAMDQVRLTTNTFDPSHGRFAGGEASVTTRRGTPQFAGRVRTQVLPPWLTFPEAGYTRFRPTGNSISGFVSGPLWERRLTAFVAADVTRRSTEQLSLLSADSAVLSALGVTPTARAELASATTALGIPLQSPGSGLTSATWQGSASARIDATVSANTSLTASLVSNWSSANKSAVGPFAYPSVASQVQSSTSRALLSGATYVWRVLEEFTISASRTSLETEGVTELPSATVQVPTQFADGSTGVATVGAGGSGSAPSGTTTDFVSLAHVSSYVVGPAAHQIKLTQEYISEQRHTWSRDDFGVYGFQSVAALRANEPSSFQRVISSPDVRAGTQSFSASLGDTWQAISGRLNVQGGLRYDHVSFNVRPPRNQRIDSAFALRTDNVPADEGFSPRLGFALRLGRKGASALIPIGTTTLGANSARASIVPADAGGVSVPISPDGVVLSGGIGAFRGTTPLYQMSELVTATGLPTGLRTLSCVGVATPTATWNGSLSQQPNSCRGGGTPLLSSDVGTARVLSNHFRAPVSWRATLNVEGIRGFGWGVVPQLSVAYMLYGVSTIERNLRAAPSFLLASEADRPVYAPLFGIDSASGQIGPGAGRVLDAIGSVREQRSDLRSLAANATVGVARERPLRGGTRVYALYSWSPQRSQVRGFSGTTAGDPREREWITTGASAHLIRAGLTNLGVGWLRFALRVSATPGVAFTPMVAQDINGDGVPNDRAFVPAPSATEDRVLAAEMQQLVNGSSSRVRSCLSEQFQTIAQRRSCSTGWTLQTDVAVSATPAGGLGIGRRWRLTANIVNATSGLVRLLHLENSPLGRSEQTTPDQRLLFVTGFDPSTGRFRYRVNQQFGRYAGASSSYRRPPLELHIGVQIDLEPDRSVLRANDRPRENAAEQMVRTRDEIVKRFIGISPVEQILQARDTLRLTNEQISSIENVQRQFIARRDSLLTDAVDFAIAHPRQSDAEELNTRLRAASPAIRQEFDRARQLALSFLTLEQRRLFATLRQP
jgi:hypothetical protein